MLAVPTTWSSAETDQACGIASTGPIDAEDLPAEVNALDCDLIGRDVDLGDVVLSIPPPGEGVSMDGEVGLPEEDDDLNQEPSTVSASIETSPDGDVAFESDPAIVSGSDPSSYDRNGCDSNYLGAVKVWRLPGTWNFWVDNEGQTGGSAYTPSDTGEVLETAGRVWQNEVSPCNALDGSAAPALNYAGATTWNGDFVIVDGTSTCGNRDGKSVIDTGNLDTAAAGTYIALNCTWWNDDNRVIESDIRFNTTNFDFTYTPTADNCNISNPDYDVRSLMTHEVGHTYGMKDKEGDVNHYQSMYHVGTACVNYQRDLGWSDILHLRTKY